MTSNARPHPEMSGPDWLRLILLSALWGGSFLFVGLALGHLPALTIVWLRVVLAAGVLAAVLALRRQVFPPRSAWGALAVMGLMNNAVPFTLYALAQGQIGAGPTAILNATTPLFTLVVAALATRDERVTGARLAGLLAGLAGVAVLMGGAAGGTLAAQAACLCAALSYACAGVWGRRFRAMGLTPLATAFGMLAASAVMLAPVMLAVDRPWMLPAPPASSVLAIAGLAVLSTAWAYILYFRLLATAGAVNLLLVTFLIPVSAIAFGLLLLGESLHPRHLAGLALILTGLAIIDGRLLRRA
jgi:drug/metabolite transporter (DMT)-like permease